MITKREDWSLFCQSFPAASRGLVRWSVSVLKEVPLAGRGEKTHRRAKPSAQSVNHNLAAPPPPFPPPHPLFFFFFFFPPFLQFTTECQLYRAAAVQWSNSTPMPHTHPMCLLLATLAKREEGFDRGSPKGGGGGAWGIWYALCMSDLYKTKMGGQWTHHKVKT